MDNSTWSLGNGIRIRFWKDSWSDLPFINEINLNSIFDLNINFDAKVSDFIRNIAWSFPSAWHDFFLPFLEEGMLVVLL